MRNRRILNLAVLMMLLLAAIGFTQAGAFAQGDQPPATPQAQPQGVAEMQSGEQIEDGLPDDRPEQEGVEVPGAESDEATSAESAADAGPDEQVPGYAGSISVSPAQTDGMTESEEASALQSMAKASASEAETAVLAAHPGASVNATELDNENGVLVYSVELSDGRDVKVDAGTGQILHTEQAGDGEG
jgi:uncharacterized membrane protein YkoI